MMNEHEIKRLLAAMDVALKSGEPFFSEWLRDRNHEHQTVCKKELSDRELAKRQANGNDPGGNGKGHTASAEANTRNPMLATALDYIRHGWNPVPVEYKTKKPVGKKWQNRIIDEASAPQFFSGITNIGIVLGATSHGLTDIDLDCAEAIAIASYILPRTGAIFGRKSKRNSHRLYYTDLAVSMENAAIAFDDPMRPGRGGRIVELRVGAGGLGAQTVFPPSVHETDETLKWEENGDPASVDGHDLHQRVAAVAAYCLLARYWPPAGSGHHDTARVVGGFLARTGRRPEAVRVAVEAIGKANKSSRWRELARTAEDAAKAHAGGKRAFGLSGLRETFGQQMADKVAAWIGYAGDPEGEGEASSGKTETPSQQEAPGQHSWDDPDFSILDDRRGDLPAFPTELLRGPWRQWLPDAAKGAGATPGHVIVPLLAISSSLIGTARRIQPVKSWSEPMSMWTAIIGFSGTGKTPGLDVIRRCLTEIEHLQKNARLQQQRAHASKAERARAEFKKWKAEVATAVENKQPSPPQPADADDPGEFVAPRLSVTNATTERLAVLLQARPRGMLYIADELAGLFLNMNRYTSGSDREFWLEAYNGGRYVVERMGRPAVTVDHLLIGMTGGFQPDKLARSFAGDNDGMYGRILFGWPEEPNYQTLAGGVAEIEPEFLNAMKRLVDLPAEENGQLIKTYVPLSQEALDVFEAFRQFIHHGKHAVDGREREWWSKGQTHVLRLAGTLAYLAWSWRSYGQATLVEEPRRIEAEFITAAVAMWRAYFWPHSRASLRQAGLSERHANARRVLRWAHATKRTQISREEVRVEALSRALDADQTHALMDSLVRAGWLRNTTGKLQRARGRPAFQWEANPKLFF
jgi:hypothetical protein